MALTVGAFLASMQRECGDYPPDAVLSLDWVKSRYAEILERVPFNFLSTEATFQTVGVITAGTITLIQGSATVTETVSNANGWTSSVVGRYFRVDGDSQFYLISGFSDTNPDSITLNRNYEGNSATLATYSIFQRIYSLASDCRTILRMAWLDSPGEIEECTQSQMDEQITNRPIIGVPRVFAMAGRDSNNLKQVELYPIPEFARGVLYRYLQETPALTGAGSTILPQVNQAIMKCGFLADYWNWRATRKDAPPNALVMAGSLESAFEKRLQEMILREAQNQPSRTLKLAGRLTKHRWQRTHKFQNQGTNLTRTDN